MTPDSSRDADRLVIYPSRVKMFLVLLGSIGFVVLGLWIGTSGVLRALPIWDVILACYVAVPFFSACGLYAAYRLVRRRPAVVIDSMGIIDTASGLGVGRLTWDEIDHVLLYKYSGQAMLGIFPRELELFLSRQSPIRRSLTTWNLRSGCAPVNVPQVAIWMKLSELAELMHLRYGVRVEDEA